MGKIHIPVSTKEKLCDWMQHKPENKTLEDEQDIPPPPPTISTESEEVVRVDIM